MMTLFGFGPHFGLEDPSPFVLKVHTYLRMADIDYQVKAGAHYLQKAPKGKLPFIHDGDDVIADSFFILKYLQKKYAVTLDDHLSEQEQAKAHLIIKSLEEDFYWCVVHSRWIREDTWPTFKAELFGKMPTLLKWVVPYIARKGVKSSLVKQGLGRHSDEEIMMIAEKSLKSLSYLLGDKRYFFGDRLSSIDAVAYGFLAQVTLAELNNPLNRLARDFENLRSYCERIHAAFYA